MTNTTNCTLFGRIGVWGCGHISKESWNFLKDTNWKCSLNIVSCYLVQWDFFDGFKYAAMPINLCSNTQKIKMDRLISEMAQFRWNFDLQIEIANDSIQGNMFLVKSTRKLHSIEHDNVSLEIFPHRNMRFTTESGKQNYYLFI